MHINREIHGSKLIFFFFFIANLGLAILGLILLSLSIYLTVLTGKSFWVFPLILLVMSLVITYTAFYGYSKIQTSRENCLKYCIALSIMLLVDLVFTLCMAFSRDSIVEWLYRNGMLEESMKSRLYSNLNTFNHILISVLILLALVVLFAWFYRRSLIENQAEWNKTLITDIALDRKKYEMDEMQTAFAEE